MPRFQHEALPSPLSQQIVEAQIWLLHHRLESYTSKFVTQLTNVY